MARRPPRGLRPDEKELWQQVARCATPLDQSKKNTLGFDTPDDKTKQPTPPQKPKPIPLFEIGSKAATALPVSTGSNYDPLRMDSKTHARMNRGKVKPEARIDLHGMTLAEAEPALHGFILSEWAKGRRLVLVITGKGRASEDMGPIPARGGVLRRQVPSWLASAPLRQAVLQVREAHQRHGGSGALYVYLARRR